MSGGLTSPDSGRIEPHIAAQAFLIAVLVNLCVQLLFALIVVTIGQP